MNTIIQIFLLYVMSVLSLIVSSIGINNNFIVNKIFLFFSLFIYQLIYKFLSLFFNENKEYDVKNIIDDVFFSSIIGILGYSFYIDLVFMQYIKFFDNIYINNFIIPLFVVFFISFAKIFNFLYSNKFL